MGNQMQECQLVQPQSGTLMSLNEAPIDATWVEGDLRVTHVGYGITVSGASDSGIQRFTDVPLVGFFCNGEISHDRLYGYTGVLSLFL